MPDVAYRVDIPFISTYSASAINETVTRLRSLEKRRSTSTRVSATRIRAARFTVEVENRHTTKKNTTERGTQSSILGVDIQESAKAGTLFLLLLIKLTSRGSAPGPFSGSPPRSGGLGERAEPKPRSFHGTMIDSLPRNTKVRISPLEQVLPGENDLLA